MYTQFRDYDTDQINPYILHVTISSLCFYTYDLYCFHSTLCLDFVYTFLVYLSKLPDFCSCTQT
jgi:hypothetical protein